MRVFVATVLIVTAVVAALPASAELQNVIVGGSLRIRGNWYNSATLADPWTQYNPYFQGPWTPSFRAAGGNPLAGARWAAQPGRLAVTSPFDWDDRGAKSAYVEQRSTVNVRADFSEMVSAFIELDSYDVWGEDFRSVYATGVDNRAATADDVEIYQAYVDANEMFGTPLRLRIGRQELVFGSQWLMGTNSASSFFPGLSFDAIRATYAADLFTVDAWWAKLADRSPLEEDGDTDFYGVYASYLGFEGITLDAYYLLLRDGAKQWNTQQGFVGEWIEDLISVDNYDPTYLHTVGLRGSGTLGAFDFEAEAAYQFGDAGSTGVLFSGAGLQSPYGPDDAEYANLGANLEVGYTFDMAMSPRVYLGAAYLGGEDNRDVSFGQWLGAIACPFWSARPSVSFNRLFSNWEYSEFIENTDLSNAWIARGGVSIKPTESTKVLLAVSYFESLSAYNATWPAYNLLGTYVTWLAPFSFIDKEHDKDLGLEVGLYGTYQYSEDLSFDVGWAHLFVGDGLAQGNFNSFNGLGYNGGTSDDDADYVFFETKLKF